MGLEEGSKHTHSLFLSLLRVFSASAFQVEIGPSTLAVLTLWTSIQVGQEEQRHRHLTRGSFNQPKVNA